MSDAKTGMFDVDDALLARYGALSLPRLGKVWKWPLLVAAVTMRRLWRGLVEADLAGEDSYFRATANIVLRPLGEEVPGRVTKPDAIVDHVRERVTAAARRDAGVSVETISQVKREYRMFLAAANAGRGRFRPQDYLEIAALRWMKRGDKVVPEGKALAEAAARMLRPAAKAPGEVNIRTDWIWVAIVTGLALKNFHAWGLVLPVYLVVIGLISRGLVFALFSEDAVGRRNGRIRAAVPGALATADVWRPRADGLAFLLDSGVIVLPGRARKGVFAVLEAMAEGVPWFGTAIARARLLSLRSYEWAAGNIVLHPLGEVLDCESGVEAGTLREEVWRRVYPNGSQAVEGPQPVVTPERARASAEYRLFEAAHRYEPATPLQYRRAMRTGRLDDATTGKGVLGEALAEAAQDYMTFGPVELEVKPDFRQFIYWLWVFGGSIAFGIYVDERLVWGIPAGVLAGAVMWGLSRILYSEKALKRSNARLKAKLARSAA